MELTQIPHIHYICLVSNVSIHCKRKKNPVGFSGSHICNVHTICLEYKWTSRVAELTQQTEDESENTQTRD